ncbi:MAG: glycosyltransferase [Clostridia bacterium]|nr:glycosyltransferase [Clostridia bacterium]
MTPTISVIVPVYNVERYLPRCIDSILSQTFTDFQLILIDDGSPDACGRICDEYAARDPRIGVIHQENAGVGSARNAGLDAAVGKYIYFIDPDDSLEPNA